MMLMMFMISGMLRGVMLVSITAELRTLWAPETVTPPDSPCTVSHISDHSRFLDICCVLKRKPCSRR